MQEWSRQLVHFSGLAFIGLAQITPQPALLFVSIAAFFGCYSQYISRKLNLPVVSFLDTHLRHHFLRFERPGVPFRGAFWFYAGCAAAFFLYPSAIATAACIILAIADSLSTVVGFHLGTNKILGKKTLEGTGMFFVAAAVIALWLFPQKWLLAALAATAGELVPEFFPTLRKRGWLDDNFLIPLFAGAALMF